MIRFFVDFDGTVTEDDVVDKMLERFAPSAWKVIEKKWAAGAIGSRECLLEQVRMISAKPDELKKLLAEVNVDPTFLDFLKRAQGLSLPVTVVSDGFDLVIDAVLKNTLGNWLAGHPLPVYCNRLQWNSKGLELTFSEPASCEHGCANCKPGVIRRLSSAKDTVIFIGDGNSDRFAAEAATLTFAKGKLLDYCRKKGIRHEPYKNFKTVEEWLVKQPLRKESHAVL
ncbi:MAG: MtnX-like HAD-IB family phosphatase [Candidatus Omnitrophica bacterium]|nr:MtnX-like HAD-IB family phosphatase [Candidatus Omnitrophota bacterium]